VIRDSEYKTLVEQSPMIIWRCDVNAKCDYFNERWLAFTGRTLQQEVGDGWAEGVHKDDFDGCLAVFLGAFARREAFEMEYRLRRHDGEYRWILDRGTPSYGPDGTFLGYVGTCVDVTERVVATERLKELTERELERLRGLLPICSHCKKIRNDAGYWKQVELYMHEETGAHFTHTICPPCLEEHYPDVDASGGEEASAPPR
jgi:PAS domain S-box-containing protein